MELKIIESKYSSYQDMELRRIRSSFSFRLGVMIVEMLKNPLRLFILPWSLFKLLFYTEKDYISEQTIDSNSIVLVGIDKSGAFYFEFIQRLLQQFQNSSQKYKISILSTGSEIIEETKEECIHYRIPSPRTIHSSYKDWNVVCERLLGTIIKITDASKVIFIGDYLYTGIINSMNQCAPDTQFLWINPGNSLDGLEKIQQKAKSIEYQKVVSDFSKQSKVLQPVENVVDIYSDNQKIIHVDLSFEKSPKEIFNAIENVPYTNVQFIQNKKSPLQYKHTYVFESDVNPYFLEGIHVRIIDDDDKKIKQMLISKTPTIVIRTNSKESVSYNSILEELEKIGAIFAIRNPSAVAINDAITTMLDIHVIEAMQLNWKKYSSNDMLDIVLSQFE